MNYYKIQSALGGLKLDFGYEFIEQDWVLDFEAKGQVAVGDLLQGPAKLAGPILGGKKAFGPAGNHAGAGVASGREPGDYVKGGPLTKPGSYVPPGAISSGSGNSPKVQTGGTAKLEKSNGVAGMPKGLPPGEQKAEGPKGDAGFGAPKASAQPGNKGNGPAGQSGLPGAKHGPSNVPAPPLGRVLGNRDWLIYIECTGDGVVVKHGNRTFPLDSLSTQTKAEHELVKCLREIVARRQATIGPGELPYRPVLQFVVHPDVFRAYYMAYPLLDALRLPMQRENRGEL
jgi:hypothetical protein